MKMLDLLKQANQEIQDEHKASRLRLLKERRQEIIAAEKNLARMKEHFAKLLDEPVDDAVFDVYGG